MATIINGDTGVSQVQDNIITTAKIVNGGITDADLGLSIKPIFSASANTATSIPLQVVTKININLVEFDTAANYSSSLSRFTPNKQGYYSVCAAVRADITSNSLIRVHLLRNGLNVRSGAFVNVTNNQSSADLTAVVWMNGTTDYIEVGLYSAVAGSSSANSETYFQAFYIGA